MAKTKTFAEATGATVLAARYNAQKLAGSADKKFGPGKITLAQAAGIQLVEQDNESSKPNVRTSLSVKLRQLADSLDDGDLRESELREVEELLEELIDFNS